MDTEKTRKPRSRERGAGKHNKGTTRVLLQLSMQPGEREEIKALAEQAGKSVSAFVVDKVLGR